jgi:hypothetical protein
VVGDSHSETLHLAKELQIVEAKMEMHKNTLFRIICFLIGPRGMAETQWRPSGDPTLRFGMRSGGGRTFNMEDKSIKNEFSLSNFKAHFWLYQYKSIDSFSINSVFRCAAYTFYDLQNVDMDH